jgi:hypothetical protein
MIEDHLLVELFDFRAHDRGRTADRPSLGQKKRTAHCIAMLSEAKHLWLTIN